MNRDFNSAALSHTLVVVLKPSSGDSDADMGDPEELRKFLLTLFGDPVNTRVSFTPAGIQAIVPGIPVTKNAQFGPFRLQVMTTTAEETAQVFVKVYSEWSRRGFRATPSLFGLNHEFEFSSVDVRSADTWLASRFIAPSLALKDGWTVGTANKVSFTIRHPEGFVKTISIEPRAGKPNFFFCYVGTEYEARFLSDLSPVSEQSWAQRLHNEFESSRKLVKGMMESKRPLKRKKK